MKIASTVMRPLKDTLLDIASLHAAYECGVTPCEMVAEVLQRVEDAADPALFICLSSRENVLAQVEALGPFDPVAKPLWGIPFAVKDNIDAAGVATTAGCPDYSYEALTDAFCIARLRAAGAILIGKTNLDQFATGLVGVRSPYGTPRNAIDSSIVPGGSSSGSAVAVARNIVSFALGIDTAGSGRVPAALNNIVGLKPTLGSISGSGVVPACRTLDTVSIFALTVTDAFDVFTVSAGLDPDDPFSRNITPGKIAVLPPHFDIVVPDVSSRQFFGDDVQQVSFESVLESLAGMGARIVPVDFTPFFEVARLLYEGPWVAERYTVVREFLKDHEDAIHPVVAGIIRSAERYSAADAFEARYRLEALRCKLEPIVEGAFALCVPTIPAFCTLEEVAAEPVEANSRLGVYTNFVNLLDMCGLAVPISPRSDGLPGSVTLLAGRGKDARVASLAAMLHSSLGKHLGATSFPVPPLVPVETKASEDEIVVAVVGAHMSGLPLNYELTGRGARFLRTARTQAAYRFYALAGGPPARPGLVRASNGASIELETWAMPKSRFGDFMQGIPAPLCIGSIALEDGCVVKGFLCEQSGLQDAEEITGFGGWRNFIASRTG